MAIPTAYNQVAANRTKTWVLMAFFTLFVLGVVWLFSYLLTNIYGFPIDPISLTGIFLIIVGVMNFAAYYWSDKIILGVSGAVPVEERNNRELYRLVQNLCIAAGTPVPKIYVIDDSAPNAFATGRDPDHAVICFTTGILSKLSKLELEAVAAHELSHIRNYDTRLMAAVTVLVGLIALLADMFFRMMWYGGSRRSDERNGLGPLLIVIAIILAIISPIIAQIIQLAVSRRREFLADSTSALLTRNPDSLASALQKISADSEPLEAANKGTAHLYIINPFKGAHSGGLNWFASLFNTHPPIKERVKALQEMQ